jgi:isoquinoline 1-oxidoreductase beta subunit
MPRLTLNGSTVDLARIGETGTSCATPALTNAVFAATGKRVRRLPIGEQLKAA